SSRASRRSSPVLGPSSDCRRQRGHSGRSSSPAEAAGRDRSAHSTFGRIPMNAPRRIRKWNRDLETNEISPVPLRVVSNEEYIPMPPTREQRRAAMLLDETTRINARRLGVNRRVFLSSSAGMASAFLALNTVFGRFFEVDPVEAVESAVAD